MAGIRAADRKALLNHCHPERSKRLRAQRKHLRSRRTPCTPALRKARQGNSHLLFGNRQHSRCPLKNPEVPGILKTIGILRLREPIRIRESVRFAQDDSCLLTRSAAHSPASRVPSVPPMSEVVFFSRTAASTAASIFSASLV